MTCRGQADAMADPEERSALDEAKDFLLDILDSGPVAKKEIEKDADGMGISWATIRRAQKALGIESRKDGFTKGSAWRWHLPTKVLTKPRRCSQNNVSTFGEFEHLRDEETAP